MLQDQPNAQEQNSSQAPSPQGQSQSSSLDPNIRDMLSQITKTTMQPRQQIAPPPVTPKAKNGSLGQDIGLSVLNMFVPFLGGAVQKHVKADRENQVMQAMNTLQVVDSELEMAQYASGGDKQKMDEYLNNSPRLKQIFQDKKIRKQMMKVFGTDLLNPEKQNTAMHEAIKRHMQLKPASEMMKQMHGLMQGQQGQDQAQPQGQPQGQPGQQPQQAGQAQPEQGGGQKSSAEMVESLPKKAIAPDYKNLESAARILTQANESDARLNEQHENRVSNLEFKKDSLDERKREADARIQQMKENAAYRKEHDADMAQYRQESLQVRRELNQQNEAIRREMLDFQMQKYNDKSRIPVQLQSRLVQTDLIDDQIDHIIKAIEQDKSLQKMMGPVQGTAEKLIGMKHWNDKLQKFSVDIESMDALFAQVHGYRGGAHVHVIFQAASGDYTFTPKSFVNGLKEYKVLNSNLRKDVEKRYANDPFFKANANVNESQKTFGKGEVPD